MQYIQNLNCTCINRTLNFAIFFPRERTSKEFTKTIYLTGLVLICLIRLENEHLNNVGKYRAFKSVPLPFNYDEDENKDE